MSAPDAKRSVKLGVVLAALAGVLGAGYLIFMVGFGAVADAVLSVGWDGFALLLLYGAANFVLLGIAWLLVVPPYSWRNAVTFCWGRAVRDSAGDILPFSQFGGMVIGARATILRGIPQGLAFASMIVDTTVEMIAQIGIVILGLVILTLHLPGATSRIPMVQVTIIGILVAILAAGAFVVVQRRGFAFLERIAERLLPSAAAPAAAINRSINAIHAAPWRMAAACVVHLLGWLFSAFGTWLALTLIQAPISFGEAIVIESLLCAARSAAVFVPAALGVQEAGYALMMPLFGLTPEVGIAISLLKRAREITLGVPVLLSWQIAEGGHAVAARSAHPPAGSE
ncbi:lysylphosphatidylglycerol synthase domain-containing protein [Vineibacter terrae]|uniref:lysylphosphatidylglycerol synthase domain-containing protein n=1 Tax=Vineibacter terrae TaxID=2586908 RepID=UPI002E3322D9|nr:lysylphosphatidylglycerol synthase domain-containing protein [Vineibacter terrae]HEX2892260.1 lysylphosphatidylglycerol synthase domain-containing protein [Vineibacter terrae]